MTRAEMLEAMARAIGASSKIGSAQRWEANAALRAIEAAGFAVVPREATDAMVGAALSRPQPDPEPSMYRAFATPEELARWLADNNASAFGGTGATYEQWLHVARGGWVPSMVMSAAGLQSGVAAISEISTNPGGRHARLD